MSCDGVVETYSICRNITNDSNAAEGVSLVLGSGYCTVFRTRKGAEGEDLEPDARVWLTTVYEFERGRESTLEAARHVVGHAGGVGAGEVPEGTIYLLLGEIGSGHGDYGSPLSFYKAVGALLACRSGDDWGLPFTEPTEDISAHKLFVEIRVETTVQTAGLGFEIFKGRDDAGCGEGF